MEPVLLFAPGAGAPSTSPWMTRWAAALGAVGPVVRFDYPYAKAGKKLPDKLPVLLACHREALAGVLAAHPERPVVLVGKSMGSRVGCHVAAEAAADGTLAQTRIIGLVCLGYPLVGAGKAQPVRDEVLVALRTPIAFAQGTRDPLCPLDALAEVRARMTAPSALFTVDGGDHGLEVGAADARISSQEDRDAEVMAAIAAWIRARVAGG